LLFEAFAVRHPAVVLEALLVVEEGQHPASSGHQERQHEGDSGAQGEFHAQVKMPNSRESRANPATPTRASKEAERGMATGQMGQP